MQVCKYNAKEEAAKGYQEAYKHARLLSARPKEATDKGSEKASEAWETTKGKAREAAEGSEKAAEAWETTKDKVHQAADNGSEKAAEA